MLKRTLSQLLKADTVELLDFLHDQLLLVDLDHYGGMARIPPGEAKLPQGSLELLWDINSMRLQHALVNLRAAPAVGETDHGRGRG